MDFRYINTKEQCLTGCSSNTVGPLIIGIDGKPNDLGKTTIIDVPQTFDKDGKLLPPPVVTPPVVVIPTPPTTACSKPEGKAIQCGPISILPISGTVLNADSGNPDGKITLRVGDVYSFIFSVGYHADGFQFVSIAGSKFTTFDWTSSDQAVAFFETPQVVGWNNNGLGWGLHAKAVGATTVCINYSHPESDCGLTSGFASALVDGVNMDNYYAACSLNACIDVVVVASNGRDVCKKVYPPTTHLISIEIKRVHDATGYDATIEIGAIWHFKATATYSDGTVLDVTNSIDWSSNDVKVATVDCFGNATGVATGTVVIRGELPGFDATGSLIVVPPASAASLHGNTYTVRPIDTVIVLDRSASMAITDDGGLSRIQRARAAANMFLASSSKLSQTAIVSFAGVWIAGDTYADDPLTQADATIDLNLTTDTTEVQAQLNEFDIRGPCSILEGEGTRCGTGIGSGLEAAQTEINSDRHVYGHKKMIVLLTDGCENINKPVPSVIADAIKTEGTLICVIALDTPLCDSALTALASPGLFFPSPTAYELSAQFAKIPHFVNYSEYGYGWYDPP